MTKKEKLLIIFGLSCIADRYGIKDSEIATKAQHDKVNLELQNKENKFYDEELFKHQVIGLIRKYVNNL